MQLYAFDDKKAIFVAEALKSKNYFCLECNGIVRSRGGRYRQKHFFHVKRCPSCRQGGKSLAHLHLQLHLLQLLPKGEAALEAPFPEISRIADVVWWTKKIIFEIQCSQISLEEAEKRSQDYAEAGFTLVWLLSDRTFNKRKISPAEIFLRTKICFYVELVKHPLIYDQMETIKNTFRIYSQGRFPVFLQHPISLQKNLFALLPSFLHTRLQNAQWYFLGDLIHRSLHESESIKDAYEKQFSLQSALKRAFDLLVRKPYETLLEILLRLCT